MNAVARYFESLVSGWGNAWNHFWFTPTDPAGVSLLRILTGSMACWFLLAFTADLGVWFGVDGLLPIEMVQELAEDQSEGWNGRASLLFLNDDGTWLMLVQIVSLAVAVGFTVGFLTRVTSVLTFASILSHVHRGPMIMGQFEPVLTLLLFYLCFAPCGRRFSVDSWWRSRRRDPNQPSVPLAKESSVAANIGQRLIQVHIAAFYVMIGLTKLASEDWWNGEAMWWLIAHTESRLVDLTFLHQYEYVINLWTYSVVVFELVFGVLIWHRLARPLLLAWAVVHWCLLGVVTGLLSYAAIMLVANVSFISAETIRDLADRPTRGS